MSEIELKNKAIAWLHLQDAVFKTRPQKLRPKEVADEVGGAYSSMGKVANEVVAELVARGVRIRYARYGNRPFFEFQ